MVEERGAQLRFRRHKGLLGLIEKVLLICIPISGIIAILDVFLYFGKSVWLEQYMAVFLGLILTLIPLLSPATKRISRDQLPWYDAILSVIGFAISFYVVIFYPDIVATSGLTPLDRTIFGGIAILFILECCRRLLGWVLVGLVSIFILYAHFSYLFSGPLYSSGVPWIRLANFLYLDPGAMLGVPVKVTGTIVFTFILFGQVFLNTGGGQFLSDTAMSLMGRFRGGPAKVSVISSGAFGTVSGSAVANVMVDGWLTIPLMMKSGYQPHFAAAVEATASTGGQIMPPVMGVTAFLMAELLGMPYAEIALSAFLPAILYYIAVFMQVDFEAGKRGLKGFPREILPQLRKALLDGWIFIIPVIVLFYTMFVLYMDADIAGLYSTVSALIVCMFKRRSRLTVKKFLLLLEAAGESLIEIGAVVGAAGLIIGVMSVSGLGFSFSMALTELAGGNMFVLLLLAAVSTTFLGMGMPVLPAYVLVSILVVPALTKMGMVPLCAHMFVFYYAVLSFLTPPICLSVYAAASIAKSKLMPTAFQALRLGIVAYIVPFIFAYSPTLLLIGTPAKVILSFILAILGVIMLSAGVEGYLFRDLKWFDRILAILGGMGVMIPLGWAEGLGGAIILILLFRQWVEKRSSRSRGI